MQDDLKFHRTLPGRIWRRLGRPPGYGRSVQIGATLVHWRVANAVGFLTQACAQRQTT